MTKDTESKAGRRAEGVQTRAFSPMTSPWAGLLLPAVPHQHHPQLPSPEGEGHTQRRSQLKWAVRSKGPPGNLRFVPTPVNDGPSFSTVHKSLKIGGKKQTVENPRCQQNRAGKKREGVTQTPTKKATQPPLTRAPGHSLFSTYKPDPVAWPPLWAAGAENENSFPGHGDRPVNVMS